MNNPSSPPGAVSTAAGTDFTAVVSALTNDSHGVVRVNNKVVFVAGALIGEEIKFRIKKRRRQYDQAILLEIIKPSPHRVDPPCEFFGICGACGLQHLAPAEQIKAKEKILREQFTKFGQCEPRSWLTPLVGDNLHYRRKARLGVKHVYKKNAVLVGFREKGTSYVADMTSCQTLDSRFSALLPLLRALIMGMSCSDRIPQIEVAAGDEDLALIFRHLDPLSDSDTGRLMAFAQEHQVQVYSQAKGPDTVVPVWPEQPATLSYHLPEFDLEMLFRATDFIQVNADMNRRMVSLAVKLLAIDRTDKVLDLFCGLGNFTLPLARHAQQLIGVEAEESLLAQARRNALHNKMANVEFKKADLYDESAQPCWVDFTYNKLLLDPPRDGALQIIKQLPKKGPERIVYVSCNPVTLARDSEYLVTQKGYTLEQAGVMDMFPHTNHVESIAVFTRG